MSNTPQEIAESVLIDFGELFAGMDPACKQSLLATIAAAVAAEREKQEKLASVLRDVRDRWHDMIGPGETENMMNAVLGLPLWDNNKEAYLP